MKALILAAGRGERMRPLTDRTPKPLIEVRGKRLIEWHLEALARAGVREVVVNTAWLEEQFPATLGDGARYGVKIAYSLEGRDHGGALETAGGIAKALPLLGDAFWVVSGDVYIPSFPFDPLDAKLFVESDALGQLWMVKNAPHHPTGDFGIDKDRLASRTTEPRLTWASVGLFRAALFRDIPVGTKMALRPRLELAMDQRRLRAEFFGGSWTDVGTMERLDTLNAPLE
jgi:MurNAc alpha-1-phosphate uridylyltransferase